MAITTRTRLTDFQFPSSSSSTVLAFNSQPFGTAFAGRVIAGAVDVGGSPSVSSITVGGVTAAFQSGSIGGVPVYTFAAVVPSGTSGNVVINGTGIDGGTLEFLYSVTGADGTIHDSAYGQGSVSLDVPAGGAILAFFGADTNGTPTGVDTDNARDDFGFWLICASRAYASAVSNQSVTTPQVFQNTALSLNPAADTARTLVADTTSIVLTAQAATLRRGRKVIANTASFALTGQAASLERGRRMVADAAAFTLTGQAVTLKRGKTLVANTASLALSGQAAQLERSRIMAAGAAALALTAQDAGLRRGKRLIAEAAALALTAQNAQLERGIIMIADGMALSLTAAPQSLERGRRMIAEGASLVLGVDDADLTVFHDATLVADPAAFVLTVQPASLELGRLLTAAPASLTLSVDDATLIYMPAPPDPDPNGRARIGSIFTGHRWMGR